MRTLAWLRNATLTLFAVGLASVVYLGFYYIAQRATSPDRTHVVPFAAHGDYVFLTRAESRNYYLLWAATIFIGMVCGWASVAHDVRLGKVAQPRGAVVFLVPSAFLLGM